MAKRTSDSSVNDLSTGAPTELPKKPRVARSKGASQSASSGTPSNGAGTKGASAERLTVIDEPIAEPIKAEEERAGNDEPAKPEQDLAVSGLPTEDEIRHRAYLRFVERGGGHGSDLEDWVHAEQELRSKR